MAGIVKGRKARAAGIGLLAAAAMLLAVPAAGAQVFNVNTTADTNDGSCAGVCSLRDATIAANTNPGTDTINVPAGTYERTLAGTNEDNSANGDLDISQSVNIIGAGAGSTIIQGNGTATGERVFDLNGGGVLIAGVTISNGFGNTQGGGIDSDNEVALTLENSIVTGNQAGAAADGGGLGIDGAALLTNVTVSANKTTGAGDGGGIYVDGAGGPVMRNVTIANNASSDQGGGIYNDNDFYLTNVTVTGNTAAGDGGGLSNAYSGTFNNVTMAGNTADSDNVGGGDGGGFVNQASAGLLTRNSIIANNTDLSGGSPDCMTGTDASVNSRGHNLVRDTTTCDGFTGPGDLTGVDPLLGPLASNGGFTQTMALQKGSPAINAGDPGVTGAPDSTSCMADDQRGVTRPQGTACDIGAYEVISNAFTIGKAKLNTKKGTATLSVTVPNPGQLTLTGKGVKPQRHARPVHAGKLAKTVAAAGQVTLTVKAKGKTKKKLKKKGKAKVKLTITYTPSGGDPATQTKSLTLKKKRH